MVGAGGATCKYWNAEENQSGIGIFTASQLRQSRIVIPASGKILRKRNK
jgi:hypothetical protein